MGFFDILKSGTQFNKIAKAIGTVIELLDLFEATGSEALLQKAAWLCRIGVLDKMEKYQFSLMGSIIIPIRGRQEKMKLNEAFFRSVGRLSIKCQELSDSDQEFIQAIMKKEQAFYDIDKNIPYEEKDLFN